MSSGSLYQRTTQTQGNSFERSIRAGTNIMMYVYEIGAATNVI